MSGNRHLFLFYFRFSLDFAFLCDILCADKTERSHEMTTEEKTKGLEHLLRKCPDVLTVIEAARWSHIGKNTFQRLIKEGKLTAYIYRGKRLISKADLIDYLVETTDDEPDWEKRMKGRRRNAK